jgi:hypothetical protein
MIHVHAGADESISGVTSSALRKSEGEWEVNIFNTLSDGGTHVSLSKKDVVSLTYKHYQ